MPFLLFPLKITWFIQVQGKRKVTHILNVLPYQGKKSGGKVTKTLQVTKIFSDQVSPNFFLSTRLVLFPDFFIPD